MSQIHQCLRLCEGGGGMNDRDQLIETHLNCVRWTISRFISVNEGVCGLEYDDLYQEGCIALWKAAETFDEQQGAQFHSYAISVIRNHLLDYCRRVQRQTVPTDGLENLDVEMAKSGAAAWDGDSSLFVEQVLDYGKRTYSGVARLGVEALELKIAGYSGSDIAELYGVKPNHVGAWISRAAGKLKKDVFSVENGGTNP